MYISEKKKLPDGETAFNKLYYQYQYSCAKSRNHKFTLTVNEFRFLVTQNCFYCEKVPSRIKKSRESTFTFNGIDRVDNSVGYIMENCVTCCRECNTKKGGVTKDMIDKSYKFLFNKNNENT